MHRDCPRYSVDRPAYSQQDFDEEFNRKRRNYPLGEKVRKFFRYVTKAELFVEVKFDSSYASSLNSLNYMQF